MTQYFTKTIETPIGLLEMKATQDKLCSLTWTNKRGKSDGENSPVINETEKQLNEYFSGMRKDFDLPLALKGTPFQLAAWKVLSTIPFGKTISYAEQAKKVGDKNKARAVGSANGKNPFPIIIPCHRVISSDGKLGGYTGGLGIKQFLLGLENQS